mmetsp:Transcript_6102/g.13539  ORF Transcript_6102/g.13539 Transcript_6102/m.13539 type:complete len:133 (-) Transcript_6102:12-410(-)
MKGVALPFLPGGGPPPDGPFAERTANSLWLVEDAVGSPGDTKAASTSLKLFKPELSLLSKLEVYRPATAPRMAAATARLLVLRGDLYDATAAPGATMTMSGGTKTPPAQQGQMCLWAARLANLQANRYPLSQ